ncbi:MAG: aspartate--ammonia ligase, partial [Oscillospiraceae bacterium]|nr:aspartate--ammonia ligase [Oscillospiraceae bacterium]
MSKTYIPKGYSTKLSLYETQKAISLIKSSFEKRLRKALQLQRVSAPLFVTSNSGLNDNLNGTERPVSFDIPEIGGDAQVVHSLAKWKRLALYRYGFEADTGLYTDMNAIRRDEELDNLHSVYVDQWDWEKVITAENRNLGTLQETVKDIVDCICDTLDRVKEDYPYLPVKLKREISFVTSQELEDMYPALSGKERENAYLKQHKTACIMQIGGLLKSGNKHDGRAPDYDDWDLNCDILFWHPILECAFVIS